MELQLHVCRRQSEARRQSEETLQTLPLSLAQPKFQMVSQVRKAIRFGNADQRCFTPGNLGQAGQTNVAGGRQRSLDAAQIDSRPGNPQ